MGAYKHMEVSKYMGVSKHMGVVQTYGWHPNIWGNIQTYGGHPFSFISKSNFSDVFKSRFKYVDISPQQHYIYFKIIQYICGNKILSKIHVDPMKMEHSQSGSVCGCPNNILRYAAATLAIRRSLIKLHTTNWIKA